MGQQRGETVAPSLFRLHDDGSVRSGHPYPKHQPIIPVNKRRREDRHSLRSKPPLGLFSVLSGLLPDRTLFSAAENYCGYKAIRFHLCRDSSLRYEKQLDLKWTEQPKRLWSWPTTLLVRTLFCLRRRARRQASSLIVASGSLRAAMWEQVVHPRHTPGPILRHAGANQTRLRINHTPQKT
jgi:hypothetical protein